MAVIVAVVSLALGAPGGWLLYKMFAAPAFLPSGARPIGSGATAQAPSAEPKPATSFLNRERVTDEFEVQTFVLALVKRIRDHLDRIARSEASAVEPTIVVGLYGEWGSGKTHWLRAIEDVFAESLEKEVEFLRGQAASDSPSTRREFTLPVRFNAWQFERETHLIIPLLKTTLAAARALTNELAKFNAPRSSLLARVREALNDKETLMALASGALTAALQLSGQFYLSGIQHLMRAFLSRPAKEEDDTARAFGWDLANEAVAGGKEAAKGWAKSAGERFQKSTADPFGAVDKLESAYFDFHAHMRRITGRDARSGLRLNLLFLIDDLDRCMPEKAVEMLESIKLFLDVPGCAFVVAIDDEVVERGILHRYRDYLGRAARGRTQTALPITGHEYLEKIIRLPFRLPPYSDSQVRAYLLRKFPSLYAPIKTPDPAAEAASGAAAQRALKSAEPRAGAIEIENPLLQFAATIVPRVPRKQIRFSELLELLCSLPGAASRDSDPKHRLLFGTVVALHLFAPELFRYVARNVPTFMARYRQWDESGAWYAQEGLLARLQTELKAKTAAQPPNRGDIEDAEYQVRLLQMTEAARQNRGGFDPRGLVAALKDVEIQELGSYLRLLTDISVTAGVAPAAAPEKLLEPVAVPREKRLEAADPRREVHLHEIEEALNGLLSSTPEARENAFERIRDRLSGGVLSGHAAKTLRERALREGFLARRLNDGTLTAWLAQLAPHWSVDEWVAWLTLRLEGAAQELIDPADAVDLVEANFSTLEAASGVARVLIESSLLDRLATAAATPSSK